MNAVLDHLAIWGTSDVIIIVARMLITGCVYKFRAVG
jgi:hypothetical protein